MAAARRLLAHPLLAALICAAALLVRVAVPSGFMLASEGGHVAITLCPGVTAAGTMPDMPGMHGHAKDGKAEMPCPFASLAAPALGAVDAVLLAAVAAFLIALGLGPAAPLPPLRHAYLRPPLRGPPLRR